MKTDHCVYRSVDGTCGLPCGSFTVDHLGFQFLSFEKQGEGESSCGLCRETYILSAIQTLTDDPVHSRLCRGFQ